MMPLSEAGLTLAGTCRDLVQCGSSLLLQSTPLLLVGLVAGQILRRHGANLRALLYQATLAGVLLSALLSLLLAEYVQPAWTLALPPAQEAALPPETTGAAAREAVTPGAGSPTLASGHLPADHPPEARPVERAASPSSAGSHGRWVATAPAERLSIRLVSPSRPQVSRFGWLCVAVAGLWAAGTLGLLAWLAFCHRCLRRLRRSGVAVPAGHAAATLERLCERQGIRPPLLLASPRVPTPFLAGLGRPAIYLPASYETQFDPDALRAILAHELAHLARRDCAWSMVARLTCALAWVQPLLWLLCRRWEQASEEVCDLAAIEAHGSPRDYARCLLDLAERLLPSPAARMMSVGVLPFRSSLAARVRQILDGSHRQAAPLSLRSRIAVAFGAVPAIAVGLFLVPGAATPASEAPPDLLAEDPRLAQKVALSVEGLPVGDLLALLKQKTGISLAAGPEVTDDKVILFDPGRPLREILGDLAALFNDRWERRPSADGHFRYTLTRDRRAREYEDLLARTTAQRVRKQLEAQVRARAAGEAPAFLANRPQDDPIRKQFADPKGRMAAKLYLLLNPVQRETLFARGRLSLPLTALSPEPRKQLRDTFVTRILAEEQATWEEESKIERDWPLSKPETLQEAGLRFQVHHGEWFSELVMLIGHTRIDVARVDSRGRWLLPPHGDPYRQEPVPPDARLPSSQAIREASAAPAWLDRLRRVVHAAGTPLMADFYRSGPITRPLNDADAVQWGLRGGEGGPAAAGRTSAEAAALDTLCQPEGYLWWTRGKTLLLRKRDWYDQRRYEAPDRWILSMAARLQARKGILTYADVLRLLELTPEQVAGLNSAFDPRRSINPYDLSRVHELLAIVQASPRAASEPLPTIEDLSPEAWKRRWLKYGDMTPRQRLLLPAFLETYSYPVAPREAEGFELRLTFNREHTPPNEETLRQEGAWPPKNDPNYRYVSIDFGFRVPKDGTRIYGRGVGLPLSLPDDRRARTKIELIP